MASIILNDDRLVLPNWRSYGETTALGELGFYDLKPSTGRLYTIDEYVGGWTANRNVLFAGELLSAAVSNSQTDREEVSDAAEFIIMNRDKANNAQIELARSIIEKAENTDEQLYTGGILDCLLRKEDIYPKIILLKGRIEENPFNPILYVEIARYYVMLGQEKKAKRAMLTAVHLSPNNRYVTRCAVRMFLYLADQKEGESLAHDTILKNELLTRDPWLLAAEVAVSMQRERYSKYEGKSKSLLKSGDYDPFTLSELASSIGTHELKGGSKKKSRDYFIQSLEKPNDNSLAQAEWAVSQHLSIPTIGKGASLVKRNYEAQSMYKYFSDDYAAALEQAELWLLDTPFSVRAVTHGSEIAYMHLKKYGVAEQILKIGLQAHPKDATIINNLAYTYALDGKLDEAEKQLDKLGKMSNSDVSKHTKVCYIATKGLVAYRRKNLDEGRLQYTRALQLAKEYGIDDAELRWNAVLNFMREEIMASPNEAIPDEYVNFVNSIQEKQSQKYITQLKQDVLALMKNRTIDL